MPVDQALTLPEIVAAAIAVLFVWAVGFGVGYLAGRDDWRRHRQGHWR